ncbi:MAG: flagellar hook-basal body complex protein FliE [candidate division Zixibacteria bacterium]|nr:flagellar hook-basal body complex protein FliE [candidate division Zixibacteria bacterium]
MINTPVNINRVIPGILDQVGATPSKGGTDSKDESNFTELFSNLLESVNGLQNESAQLQDSFLAGEPVELHQVMIKAEEAGVSMDLLLEIRNKLVNAYSELIRMPV